MKVLHYTLVCDGTTDANLVPIIDWTLRQSGGVDLTEGTVAELWRLREKPVRLAERMVKAVELFPCDALFVHRDAEKQSQQTRMQEIALAYEEAATKLGIRLPATAVVPVHMLEAWLLFDELAIRHAAGNPNGNVTLNLPPLARIESRPSPKEDLRKALLVASELAGRRKKKFDIPQAFWRIVDHIQDFSPLRSLPAFQAFEHSVIKLRDNGWKPGFCC